MLDSTSGFASGTYAGVRDHILQRLRSKHIHDQVFAVVQAAYGKALEESNVVLSRPEKERLLADVLKSVLAEMKDKLH